MKLIDSLAIAIRSLLSNKLRSSLTMLGVIIGVGAVITLVSVGRGAQATVTASFEGLGTNVLYIQPRNPDAPGLAALSPLFAGRSLSVADAEALAQVSGVIGVAPLSENFVEVVAGDKKVTVMMDGSTPAYLKAFNFQIASGQFITDRQVASRDMVVVLGGQAATDLFGPVDPVGQTVKIKGKRFAVIGVLQPTGRAFFGMSMDDVVVTPITTYQTRLFAQRAASGEYAIQSIAVQLADSDTVELVKADMEAVLRKSHRLGPGDENDFAIVSQEQVLGIFQQVTTVFTIFLGAIASISLIVGGIGIMNIMLVSVTERTREIGLRKAVGAKRRDILVQFLLEAATLSLIGGGVGITGGWLVSLAVSRIDIGGGQTIQAAVSPDVVLVALSVSMLVGLVSGIYPAMRAARLNPIEALHYG